MWPCLAKCAYPTIQSWVSTKLSTGSNKTGLYNEFRSFSNGKGANQICVSIIGFSLTSFYQHKKIYTRTINT